MKCRMSMFSFNLISEINKVNPLFLNITLFIVFLCFNLGIYNFTSARADTAKYLNNSLRVLNGEVPYKDFWVLYPPGTVYLTSFIFRMGGININNVFIFSLFISALIGVFSFSLGKIIFKSNFLSTIASLLVFYNGIPAKNGTYTNIQHIYFLFLLVSSYFFIRFLLNGKFYSLFISGIFIGWAFLFRFYEVLALFLAIFLVIVINIKLTQQSVKCLFKSVIIFCCGVFVILLSFYFFVFDIFKIMIKQVVVEGFFHGLSSNLPYFIDVCQFYRLLNNNIKVAITTKDYLCCIENIFVYFVEFINAAISYLFPFLILSVALWFLLKKNLNRNYKIIFLFFSLWGLFTFPKGLGRSDLTHVSQVNTPLYFLLVLCLQKILGKYKFRIEKLIKVKLIIITFVLLWSVPYYFFMYAIEITKPHYAINTKYANLYIRNKERVDGINAVVDFITNNSDRNDYIFVTYWFAPPFYVLANRRNPTYYDELNDLILRPSEYKQRKVCNDILSKETRIIIHNPNWGIDDMQKRQFLYNCPILQKCIEDNFRLIRIYGPYWIYVQKKGRGK